jgi:DEAD/DEAH box helicase domain-containing protein
VLSSSRTVDPRGKRSRTRLALPAPFATIVFAQSRLATEVLLATIKRAVEDKTGDSGMVRGYRGGYLPLRRREVEQGLRSGEVKGVVTTSALELGIDIGLDVAVSRRVSQYHASVQRQAGRAGRRTSRWR